MGWRLAQSLTALRAEVDRAYPRRSKVSDGTIGDRAHRRRKSDHNPDRNGVVRAWDVTEDGDLVPTLTEFLRASRDRRISYVISRGRMFSSYPTSAHPAWTWRPYSGSNPHDTHCHISVADAQSLYDDPTPWGFTAPDRQEYQMRRGDTGNDVKRIQKRLKELGWYDGQLDGDFGPKTEAAVRAFQTTEQLDVTGVVSLVTAVHLQAVAHGVAHHR